MNQHKKKKLDPGELAGTVHLTSNRIPLLIISPYTYISIFIHICVMNQVIVKTVTNTEYIKTTEFVEVDKTGPDSVSGSDLPEGPGRYQQPLTVCL